MTQVANAIPIQQGVDQTIPIYPKNPNGTAFAVGLQSSDGCRMELRENLTGEVVQLMTSPTHFTINPGATGSENILIRIYGEESIDWSPNITYLYGTLLIYDSSGNSRPGSGVPVILQLEPSFTRSKSSVGI